MHVGRLVFAQLMDHLPWKSFSRIVERYGGDRRVREFSCANQFRCMAFAQLTFRESLRDIEACLRAQRAKLYHLGILDELLPEPGAFYVMDRAFVHFEALHRFHEAGAFFVLRARSNLNVKRRYSAPVDRSTGLICDQTVLLNVYYSKHGFPEPLRRIKIRDTDSGKAVVLLTNNFALPALTIGELYRCRWQVELFFKWIKQHLRIKAFFGTSEHAVKTQIWIAVSVYVLVAIVRKRLHLDASLYELLQILSLTMFERTPLHQLLTLAAIDTHQFDHANQLKLFDF